MRTNLTLLRPFARHLVGKMVMPTLEVVTPDDLNPTYLLKMVAKTPNPTIRDLFPKWVETWWASRNPGTGAGCPKAMKKNFGATKLFNYHTACILQNLLLYTINPRQGYGAPLWAVHLVQLIRDHLSVWVASSFVRPQNE